MATKTAKTPRDLSRAERGIVPGEGLPSSPSPGAFTAEDRQRMVRIEQMLKQLLDLPKSAQPQPAGFLNELEYRRAIWALKKGDRRPLDLYKKRGGIIPHRAEAGK